MAPRIIDTATAATEKGCSRIAILDALKRAAIDGQRTGRYYVVFANKKYNEWQPNPNVQKSGRARARKAARAKKAK